MTAWRHCSAGTLSLELQPKKIGNVIYVMVSPTVQTIMVEHRERLVSCGVGMVEAMLQARGCDLIVIDSSEVTYDLVQDMSEILEKIAKLPKGESN